MFVWISVVFKHRVIELSNIVPGLWSTILNMHSRVKSIKNEMRRNQQAQFAAGLGTNHSFSLLFLQISEDRLRGYSFTGSFCQIEKQAIFTNLAHTQSADEGI